MPSGARRSVSFGVLIAWLGVTSLGAADPPPPNPRPLQEGHAYILTARLDPATHTVEGTATITWRNESRVAVRELWLHRYLEAFRHARTVFMRESGEQLRGVRFRGGGGLDVHALTWEDVDLLAGVDDDPEADDRTQLRVPLPREVAPGEQLTLEARFTAHLPPVFARSGYHGDFHCVAQWFPKLARLEPDGTWATFPYHGHGEFYADFARYELDVIVPSGWTVVATGARQLPREGEPTADGVRHRFAQDHVHDAVFVAAPWFQRLSARFEGHGRTVEVELVHPPGFGHAAARHLEVTLAGLAHFAEHFGPYPYDQLTVVVPPAGADGAAGMEYPTLFVTAGPWLHVPGLPMALLDEVTAHELAHQWFQGLVATHEVRWPMLDEGITEWATGDLLERLHGRRRSGVSLLGVDVDGFEIRRALALRGRPTPPPARPVTAFKSGYAYGRSVYFRTSVILETVARTWGRARFRRALGRYARTQRFRHPTPDDLFAAFDAEYGPWMSREILRPALFEGALSEIFVAPLERDGGHTRVVAERRGLPIPRRVELRGPSGRRGLEWPGDAPRLELREEGEWTSVWVDPDGHALLDADRRDDARGARDGWDTWVARALTVAQALLGAVGP
ncbi:MAG: M1 family metallopeptidase [Myxococcales bacterium]|nr:M1 family metallopeptidase [Myxococcales bacterium]